MQQPIQLRKGHEKVSVPCLKMNGLIWICLSLKGGSINYHRKVFSCQSFYVLSSCGLFLVQFICSFSRIARYTPSLTNKLTTKNSLAN